MRFVVVSYRQTLASWAVPLSRCQRSNSVQNGLRDCTNPWKHDFIAKYDIKVQRNHFHIFYKCIVPNTNHICHHRTPSSEFFPEFVITSWMRLSPHLPLIECSLFPDSSATTDTYQLISSKSCEIHHFSHSVIVYGSYWIMCHEYGWCFISMC